ncbi:hypothetical protein FQN57_001020 [Myotisia sp. PD_48]|nr:hypothetical protein FQN57_001020 [Myotisia sp. PD_48]
MGRGGRGPLVGGRGGLEPSQSGSRRQSNTRGKHSGPSNKKLKTSNRATAATTTYQVVSATDATGQTFVAPLPQDAVRQRRLWTPVFLRRVTILTFLLTFVTLLTSVIGLYVYSHRNEDKAGIDTEHKKYYYLWTFGPTGVFVFVGTFWYQVEYRACQLMPWILMSQRALPIHESILLDYISDWNVISLFKSFKRKHYLVSLATAGSLLVNGLAVVSTSLFELRAVDLEVSTPLRVTHSFKNSSRFDPYLHTPLPYVKAKAIMDFNSSLPLGIFEDYAFTPFKPLQQNATSRALQIETAVDVLRPELDCVEATKIEILHQGIGVFVNLSVDGCRCEQQHAQHLSRELTGKPLLCLSGVRCPRSPNTNIQLWAVGFELDPEGDLEVDREFVRYDGDDDDKFRAYASMCFLRFNATRGPVRISRNQTSDDTFYPEIDFRSHHTTKLLPGLDPGLLLLALHQSMISGGGADFDIFDVFPSENNMVLGPNNYIPRFIRAVKYISTIIVHEFLLIPENRDTDGVIRVKENRLFVRDITFYLLVVLLSILIIIAIVLLLFFVPVTVCPRDPSSIAGLSIILAQDPGLTSVLSNSTLEWPREMQESLSTRNYLYRTTSNPASSGSFAIKVQNMVRPRPSTSPAQANIRWWRPASTRPYIFIPIVAAPLVMAAAIETLFRFQKSSGGIFSTGGRSRFFSYLWTYVPALLMFGLRCLLQLLEFNARIFYPFHQLPNGNTPARISVSENQHRKLPIYNIFDSLRKRQWALAAGSIMLLLSAWLPVAVSGLYSVDKINITKGIQVSQTSTWDVGGLSKIYYGPGKVDSRVDNYIPSMILQTNLSYPKWTYKDLAFLPVSLSAQEVDGEVNLTTGNFATRLPAWRLNIDCIEMPANSYKFHVDRVYGRWIVVNDMKHCNASKYPGVLWHDDNPIGPVDYYSYAQFGKRPKSPAMDICSRMHYWLETELSWNRTEKITVLRCRPKIEEVDVDVLLKVPSLDFDLSRPPSVVMGSARVVHDHHFDGTNSSVYPVYSGHFLAMPELPFNHELDPETAVSITSRYGVPIEELISNSTKLIDSLTLTYGIVLAQILNTRCHAPVGANGPANTFPATFTSTEERLIQNIVPTRILECLLVLLTICGIITVAFLNTKKVLPKNPCSIGALASLLVKSRMVKDKNFIPRGAEWLSDEELLEHNILVTRRFRMALMDANFFNNRARAAAAASQAKAKATPSQTTNISQFQPWVEKYRPNSLDDIAAQDHTVTVLQRNLHASNLPHMLFYGPPGTGKTSTIIAMSKSLFGPLLFRSRVLELNASDERGISVVREKIKGFARMHLSNPPAHDSAYREQYPCPPFKIVILDEADSMTHDAQAALRRTMEKYSRITRFCLVCNYVTRIIDPLASRCSKFRFKALDGSAAGNRLVQIAEVEKLTLADGVIDTLLKYSDGDLRKAITFMQSAARLAGSGGDVSKKITVRSIEEVSGVVPKPVVDRLINAIQPNSRAPAPEAILSIVTDTVADGWSATQILSQVWRPLLSVYLLQMLIRNLFQAYQALLWNESIRDEHKNKMLKVFSEFDKRLIDGADEHLTILDFILQLSKIIHAR